MSKRCPQDGGFIGESGCTHPNHKHSALVEKILSAKEPRLISVKDANNALDEGFYVKDPSGQRVGFGKALLRHLENHHTQEDSNGRKMRLQFAVKTVMAPDCVERKHRGYEGRTAYTKAFNNFGILVLSGKGTDEIEYVFDLIPKRNLRKEKKG